MSTDPETINQIYFEPIWATYCHIATFVSLIAISFPCCSLFYYGIYEYMSYPCRKRQINISNMEQQSPASNSGQSSASNSVQSSKQTLQTTKSLPWYIKTTLLVSISFSYIYVLLQAIFSTFRIGITDDLNKWICLCWGGPVLSYIFICGRVILYWFFILRAFHIFKESAFGYTKSKVVYVFIAIVVGSQVIGVPLLILNSYRSVTVYQNKAGGELCWFYTTDPNNKVKIPLIYLIIHAYGGLIDIVTAIYSIYLVVNPLFKLIAINEKSSKNNGVILLVTRLLILLAVVVISSQMVMIIYLLLPVDFSAILYPLDVVINTYCLWLTFSFNDKYHYNYFCGISCVKICFPFVKAMALTNHNFFCCCCTYWCGCDKEKKLKQASVRESAKQEVELIVQIIQN
eukprot:198027_1